jgi:ADP-heptose:LPS heptosyltransferase
VQEYTGPVKNLSGETSLLEMLDILKGAKFLLAVDTGAVHLAAAVGCPVIGLFSGKSYGRFAPYPSSLATEFYSFFPDHIDKKIASNESDIYDTSKIQYDVIRTIPPAKIYPFIDKIMARHSE